MTENEFSWNELVSKNLPPDAPFKVPYSVEEGFYDERLFFFISEFFDRETLADKNPPRTKGLAGWIPVVANATNIIGNIRQWPKVNGRKQSVGEILLASATEWASQLQSNTEQLLEIIEKSETSRGLKKEEEQETWIVGKVRDKESEEPIVEAEITIKKGESYNHNEMSTSNNGLYYYWPFP